MRSRLVLLSQLSATALAASLFASVSHADLQYTMSMKMDMPGMPPEAAQYMPKIKTTFYYTTGKERTDSSVSSAFFSSSTQTIDDCGADTIYTVDPKLNIYYTSDMGSAVPDPFGISGGFAGMGGRMRGGAQAPKPPAYHGTVTMNVKVTSLGDETINDVLAHHHKVTITYTTTGTVPAMPTEPMSIDIWTDDTPRPVTCATQKALNASTAAAAPAANGVKYIFTGDMTGLGASMKGVPVRIQFAIPKMTNAPAGGAQGRFGGGGGTITMDRTDMSTDSIDADQFAPPSDATKVTKDDYESQQQAAMQKRMGGFGGGVPPQDNQ